MTQSSGKVKVKEKVKEKGFKIADILAELGINKSLAASADLAVHSPVDGTEIGRLHSHSAQQLDAIIGNSVQAYSEWRTRPAPVRGELVRVMGNKLRQHKQSLGALVSWECGKIYQEGLGEVQEMIDICDFAVGLSRQLYGLTIASERPGHRMSETWHPMGPVGVISAFNFPVAVWCWNSALALVCGDSVIWKPSEKTPLTALAWRAIPTTAPSLSITKPRPAAQSLASCASASFCWKRFHRNRWFRFAQAICLCPRRYRRCCWLPVLNSAPASLPTVR